MRYLWAVGILCLVYVLWTLDYGRLGNAWSALEAEYLVAACVLSLLGAAAKAFRWKLLVAAQSGSITLWRCFLLTIYLGFIGTITPGRVGELLKIGYLKDSGLNTVEATANLVMDRLSDVAMMLCVGLAALAWQRTVGLDVGALVGLIALCAAAALFAKRVYSAGLGILSDRWREFVEDFVHEIRNVRLRYVALALAVTVVGILTIQLQIYLIALGLGIEIGFLVFLPIMLAANLVALLPISVSGLGTRELVLIRLLGLHDVSPEVAALVSFIDVVLVSYCFRGGLALAVRAFRKRLLPRATDVFTNDT